MPYSHTLIQHLNIPTMSTGLKTKGLLFELQIGLEYITTNVSALYTYHTRIYLSYLATNCLKTFVFCCDNLCHQYL